MTVNLLAVKERCLSATHPQGLVFMCRSGIWVQGMCFLSAIHPFGGKNLYREQEIGGRHVILSAIHSFCRNTLCRVLKRGAEVMFSVCDTPSRVSFHVSERHLGSGHVFSVRDTPFWWKKPVSRAGNRGKTCYFVCDTPFLQKYLVSRAKKGCSGNISVNDTPFLKK